MNRGYNRDWYINRINKIREIIPNCGISHDIISSFCTESEKDHNDTLSLMEEVKFDYGYMFKYSERPNTKAARKFKDNVSENVKSRRLSEIIEKQRIHSLIRNREKIGNTYKVLVEGISKKSNDFLYGRTTHNLVTIFPKKKFSPGDYVKIKIKDCNSATLFGESI
jgi:tRNA-2-methylthio-N6-dimethylallyladenosine synthase